MLVAETVAAIRWHREKKSAAALQIGNPETRLTKWLKRETWTPKEAALLVYGFDPGTYTTDYMGQGIKCATGLCGGAFLGDATFADALELESNWHRRIDTPDKVKPGEFVLWCGDIGIDAGWLRDVPLPPERRYFPIAHAALGLSEKVWPWNKDCLARAECKLERAGGAADDDGMVLTWPGVILRAREIEANKIQPKIDALLKLGKLPLYEWPSRIRTDKADGAWVNEAELVQLLIHGAHLLPVAPDATPEPQAAPEGAAPVMEAPETQVQRQARRWQLCIDAGLAMPDNDYAALPRGIGKLAKAEEIRRQSFAEDVKAHINRMNAARD